MIELLLVGLNHSTAPIAVREKFNGTKQSCEHFLSLIRSETEQGEAALLATCNRFEIYTSGIAERDIVSLLAKHGDMPIEILAQYLYIKNGSEVSHHLFRVAAGLDSIVLGEDQILGQVAGALQLAQTGLTSGRALNTLFQHAIAAGKRVRNETGLGEGSVSVGRAAVDLAREKLGTLQDLTVLILGAGKISELAAKHLVTNGTAPILVANRTHAHADELASRIGGRAVYFEDLCSILPAVDIVLSSTSAPHYVLYADLVAEAMSGRPEKPMMLIDLAVPRDIEPAVASVAGTTLYNIDDLRSVQAESFKRRQDEVPRAESVINEALGRFRLQTSALQASGVIQALHEKLEQIRLSELNKISHILADLSPEQRNAVCRATESIAAKFLHEPTVSLKEMHLQEKSILSVVTNLFRLPSAKKTEVL